MSLQWNLQSRFILCINTYKKKPRNTLFTLFTLLAYLNYTP